MAETGAAGDSGVAPLWTGMTIASLDSGLPEAANIARRALPAPVPSFQIGSNLLAAMGIPGIAPAVAAARGDLTRDLPCGARLIPALLFWLADPVILHRPGTR